MNVLLTLESWFNSPRGHIVLGGIAAAAAQAYPQYATLLQTIAWSLGYGAVVAGATVPKPSQPT